MAHATGMTSLIDDLLANGHEFTFVQIMRLARRFLDPAGEMGLPEIPWQDRVRVRPELSLAFPASDVAGVDKDGDDLRITATFLGLYGAASPLPTFFTEDLMDEASSDESVCRDFLDIIHQRLYHLWFQCWSKYRLIIRVVEENNPIDKERLLCLIGLGEKELADSVPDAFSLLRYTGILTQYPRSAMGLKTILRDALGMNNIRIIQNIRRMVSIPDDQRMRMLVSGRRLGMDTVLGSKIADRTGRFRIRIGPLTWREFNDLLPGTPRNDKLAGLTGFYLTDPLEVELELVLAAGEAQPIRIGDPEARLGLNTWDFAGSSIGEVSALFRVETLPNRKHLPSPPETAPPKTGQTFVDYYRKERALLGELADRFAGNHPNLAPLVSGSMADSGVERLLEGTAFLNALLQRKLDDDIPEFINEEITPVQPEHMLPVPASTIIAFTPKVGLTRTQVIPAGAEVLSVPVQGTGCRFRTCYDVTVHPLSLLDASFSHPSGKTPRITLQLELNGMELSSWKARSLSLFLNDSFDKASDIYLQLIRRLERIIVNPRGEGKSVILDNTHIRTTGFAEITGEAIRRDPYLMMREYFHDPRRLLFVEVSGWEKWRERGSGNRFELCFELEKTPEKALTITRDSFVLYAVPAVNLFTCDANPIQTVEGVKEYRVKPHTANKEHIRIRSINGVSGVMTGKPGVVNYAPCGKTTLPGAQAVYHTIVKRSPMSSELEFFISVSGPPKISEQVKLSLSLTCTNGELPSLLETGDIRLPSPSSPEFATFRNIGPVSPPATHQAESNRYWKLFSGLSSNRLHFAHADNLRAVLKGCIPQEGLDFKTINASKKRLEGIVAVETRATDRLICASVRRGWEFRIQLNGDCYASMGDLYLFASVLERFMGNYATELAYTRLIVEVVEETKTGVTYEWPPRFGLRPLM